MRHNFWSDPQSMSAPWLPFASLGTQAKIGKFGKNVFLLRKSLAENARSEIGGDNQVGVQYTDSWNWDGANWVQLFPASTPTARTSPNMTFDSTLGVIVLFGGYAEIWEDSLNDTWTWNGRSWTQIYPATVPPNRYNFGMVYDPILKAVLMFGGFSSTVVRGDTWLLALAP